MGLSLMIIVTLIPWVIAIIALWRGMKAHESLTESLRMVTESQKRV